MRGGFTISSGIFGNTFLGQAMEAGLRECLKSVRVGHVLIQHSKEEKCEPELFFCHLPAAIETRRILLMDPMLGTECNLFFFF